MIEDIVESYTLALAFPANATQPLLWWEAANLYLSQGSYEGALALFNRVCLDFADYNRITSVIMCRAATYRRVQYVTGTGDA